MAHHTIVVCGVCFGIKKMIDIKSVHKKAKTIFPYVSPLSPKGVNGYQSFFIPPDGSKERWDASDEGNRRRDEFIKWLKSRKALVDWVEVQFGDDKGILAIREK